MSQNGFKIWKRHLWKGLTAIWSAWNLPNWKWRQYFERYHFGAKLCSGEMTINIFFFFSYFWHKFYSNWIKLKLIIMRHENETGFTHQQLLYFCSHVRILNEKHLANFCKSCEIIRKCLLSTFCYSFTNINAIMACNPKLFEWNNKNLLELLKIAPIRGLCHFPKSYFILLIEVDGVF